VHHVPIIFSILISLLWSSAGHANGIEENDLLKYLENLRKAGPVNEMPPAPADDTSPITKILKMLDDEEPDLEVLAEEIAHLESTIKPSSRKYLISRYAVAIAYQNTKQYEKAASLADTVLSEKISRDWQYAFYEVFFLASWELDDFKAIVQEFARYSKVFGIARKNEKIAVIAYQSYVKEKEETKAIEILEELARGYPASEHARFAFSELVDLTCDPIKRYVFSSKLLIDMSRNNDIGNGIREFALANIDQVMVMDDGSKRRLSDYEKTDFLFKTRMFDEALKQLRNQYEIVRHEPDNPQLPELMFGLARTLMRLQDYKASAMFASKFLSQYPTHGLRNNMKEVLADSMRYLNIASTASSLYRELTTHTNADHFRWQTFWTLYVGRKYEDALSVLKLSDTKSENSRISDDGYLYWEANLLEKIGQKDVARIKFAELLDRYPNSFYASYLQVDRKLKLPILAKLKNKPTPETIDVEGMRIAALRPEPQKDDEIGPNRLAEVITFAEDLSGRGRDDLARLYLSQVDSSTVSDWPTYKGLADISFRLGVYKPTRLIKYKKFSPLRSIPDTWFGYQSHIRDNGNHWKVYFPKAYDNVVGPVSEVFNRSRFLILSIMRAESFYNNEARSPVGAVGLMQMMPYTAIKIASLVKDFDFQMSELSKPEVSIGYGAYYIDKLQRYYQENPILAVAAYNAGPRAVNQWIETCRQCSMDEFVESIPYKETRNYVKKVISYFFNYFRVYDDEVPNFQNLSLPEYIPDTKDIF
jgi:tetratricopeptide (TPR) repeat protein